MFDVTKFIERNNWTIEDLAARLFGKGGKSRVGMWKTGDSTPRYAQILALIDLGVTAEELFGKEHADKLLQNSSVLPQLPSEITNDPGFTIGQKKALKDIETVIEARITAKLKEKGIDL